MFARLRSEQAPTPVKSDSPIRLKSFKHRLLDEDEEDDNMPPPSPKRHKQKRYSVAPVFDKYKRLGVDEDEQVANRHHNRRQQLSPSPNPLSPLVKELNDRYVHLRATLHSAALSSLSSAESQLSAASESSIRANRQKAASLESQLQSLVAPLQDLTVDYTAVGENGRPRTAAVSIRDAVAAFAEKLESTVAELDGLWAEWAAAQAEIEELGSDVRVSSRKGSRLNIDSSTKGMTSASASHSEALVGFGADLDKASKDVVEEMVTYEEKFLKEIEKEAGKILHSFLNR
ncbi:hypothetical protein F4781DRAFT_307898 [Annulohypoxylon bovei var. microspora]|nr:hypothetical protein F4781DRAFT_307898 [Annulohypoxylon bovei var. microspora]